MPTILVEDARGRAQFVPPVATLQELGGRESECDWRRRDHDKMVNHHSSSIASTHSPLHLIQGILLRRRPDNQLERGHRADLFPLQSTLSAK